MEDTPRALVYQSHQNCCSLDLCPSRGSSNKSSWHHALSGRLLVILPRLMEIQAGHTFPLQAMKNVMVLLQVYGCTFSRIGSLDMFS